MLTFIKKILNFFKFKKNNSINSINANNYKPKNEYWFNKPHYDLT